MEEVVSVFRGIHVNQLQGGIVTAVGLMFAWFILGRLIDLLLELLWMVWIGLTLSATCYLPTVWVYKQTKRVKLKKVLSKNLCLATQSDSFRHPFSQSDLTMGSRPSGVIINTVDYNDSKLSSPYPASGECNNQLDNGYQNLSKEIATTNPSDCNNNSNGRLNKNENYSNDLPVNKKPRL